MIILGVAKWARTPLLAMIVLFGVAGIAFNLSLALGDFPKVESVLLRILASAGTLYSIVAMVGVMHFECSRALRRRKRRSVN